jgi:hypothetical protein
MDVWSYYSSAQKKVANSLDNRTPRNRQAVHSVQHLHPDDDDEKKLKA